MPVPAVAPPGPHPQRPISAPSVCSQLPLLVGILLSVVIWTTAEGFGGPYTADSTDIGAAIIYVLVFAGLFLASAGLYWGVDRYLAPLLRRFKFLASDASDLPARKQIVAASSLFKRDRFSHRFSQIW